jgi:two-component system sensor histidine kinase RstB
VRRALRGRNRRLLYRSYLTLVGGLLVVAVVLDFGFRLLQTREPADQNPWLEATFRLIEARLASVPVDERERVAAAAGAELGFDVRLLRSDDVYANDIAEHRLAPLVDGDGNTSYLQSADSIGAIIRLGPIDTPQTNPLLRLLPPIFYLSIFVVVGIWLRPLLRDIDVISKAAQRFAADYREPLATADQTSELKSLACNLDEMAARLSGVLRSQKELIAALSHEMRTPLARLRFAIALSREAADDEFKQKLSAMNDDVHAIDELIASMLNYARLDHPDIEMRWQFVPSVPWLERIVGKSAQSAIEISVSADRSADRVNMDPRLMELALSNLIVNALKYARQRVRCKLTEGPDAYVLSVEDDGPGIPEDHREMVFRAFTRIDDSRNRDTGGSGLGLAVVARVAELHGGAAGVASSPELKGARFTIRWPRAQPPR